MRLVPVYECRNIVVPKCVALRFAFDQHDEFWSVEPLKAIKLWPVSAAPGEALVVNPVRCQEMLNPDGDLGAGPIAIRYAQCRPVLVLDVCEVERTQEILRKLRPRCIGGDRCSVAVLIGSRGHLRLRECRRAVIRARGMATRTGSTLCLMAGRLLHRDVWRFAPRRHGVIAACFAQPAL